MNKLILVALLLWAAPAAAQQRVDETIRTAATGVVRVSNLAGNVIVEGWDRNEIRVTGVLGRGTERLAITGDAEQTEIRVIIPQNSRNVEGSDLRIRVPAGKRVEVHTTSADISADGVTGPLELLSTSGDVTISGNPQSLSATSTSGDVEIAGSIPGQVRAKSTSGDIRIGGAVREGIAAEVVSGDIEITANSSEITANAVSGSIMLSGAANRISTATVSGDTEIRTSRINYGAFESVSGDVRFEAALEPGAALTLTTHSGEVEAVFPADVSADFRATTFSGRIQNEFGEEARRTSRYAPGSELRFSTGNDGVVVLKSFSGAIRIMKR